MGYDVTYEGSFAIAPPLSRERLAYLAAFLRSSRRPRDVAKLPADQLRTAVGLELGDEGGLYVGGASHRDNDQGDPTVTSFARPPQGQPSVRCCFELSAKGDKLSWDGCEKFGHAAQWLSFLLSTFFTPWGHALRGEMRWRGEDDATGTIRFRRGRVIDEPDKEDPSLEEEVQAWIQTLASGEPSMRLVAAKQIGCAVHASVAMRTAAIAALGNALDPPELAVASLETLGDFGESSAAVLPAVAKSLDSPSAFVRYWATYALGRMGPAARQVLPALEKLTHDREDGPRYGAIDAIKRLS